MKFSETNKNKNQRFMSLFFIFQIIITRTSLYFSIKWMTKMIKKNNKSMKKFLLVNNNNSNEQTLPPFLILERKKNSIPPQPNMQSLN